jgi:hypothetical protein
MVQSVAASTLSRVNKDASEIRRKALLAESDALLDDVESLRLVDRVDAPQQLREAIRALQVRLGRSDPPPAPATLHAAHDLVFAVQQRLMAANPHHARPNRHAGRPGGQPIVTVVREDRLWKLLTLPNPPAGEPDDDWMELVDCTVERAWDRWCYAQQHAVRAAQEGYKAHVAWAVASTAWSNYWELDVEARRIKERLRGRAAATSAGSPAALHA